MSPKPLATAFLILSSCLPVLADSPTAPATVPTQTPTNSQTGSANANNMIRTNMNALGIDSQTKHNLMGVKTVGEAHQVLQEMMDAVNKNATDPKYKTIATRTVQKISQSLKDDSDFQAHKSELQNLPTMLAVQISLDQFNYEKSMRPPKPSDDATLEKLNEAYAKAMPKTPTPAKMPAAEHTMGTMVMPEDQASKPQGNVAQSAPYVPLMSQFHNYYREAEQTWDQNHKPEPLPTPTPTPPVPAPTPVGPSPAPSPDDGPIPHGGNGASPNSPNGYVPGFPPIQHIQDMISSDPNQPANWKLSADYKLQTGDFNGALSDAQRAVSLGGGADARVAVGEAKFGLGDLPGANEAARAALQSDPENQKAMALLHFSDGRTGPKAPKSLADGFQSSGSEGGIGGAAGSPSLRGALMNLAAGASRLNGDQARKEAMNALKLNDMGGALVYVNRALELDPNNPSLLNMRASIYARQHEFDKAADDAKAGLALAPQNAALLRTLGYAQLRGKHYKDALASSEALIKMNPKDAYAYALRAHAYGSLGDRDAMMADINRAAALDPRFQPTAAQMAALVQLPSDKDLIFLFPGEETAPAPTAAAPAGRGRSFGLLVGASAVGGLLLALGLLQTVLAPLKAKVTSVFTRVAGAPAPARDALDTARPASVNGLLPGLIRGQYEVSRQIGQGGMGTVFEGTDRSLGRRVAIKKMREELRINPAERARFVIEAKTVAALHHPNIVDIYAIAEDGDDVFLVFEYVDGKTVHDLIQSRSRLEPVQAVKITRATADALGFAHSRGVIHRDMKPSNVMIDASGRVKVMDFGIARVAKDSMTRFSMTNTVVGTPPYMAPEQEQGQVRRESDVYALAVCAYEMLTGKLPFVGVGAGMLMNKINMSYVAPSRATAGLPESLDPVFAKAFQADPGQRYRTPQEFADALESAFPSGVRA